jgi:hypothetical protein
MQATPYEVESREEEIVIRIPRTRENEQLVSRMLNYFDVEVICSKSKAKPEDIEALAKDVKKAAWERVKPLFENALEGKE